MQYHDIRSDAQSNSRILSGHQQASCPRGISQNSKSRIVGEETGSKLAGCGAQRPGVGGQGGPGGVGNVTVLDLADRGAVDPSPLVHLGKADLSPLALRFFKAARSEERSASGTAGGGSPRTSSRTWRSCNCRTRWRARGSARRRARCSSVRLSSRLPMRLVAISLTPINPVAALRRPSERKSVSRKSVSDHHFPREESRCHSVR